MLIPPLGDVAVLCAAIPLASRASVVAAANIASLAVQQSCICSSKVFKEGKKARHGQARQERAKGAGSEFH